MDRGGRGEYIQPDSLVKIFENFEFLYLRGDFVSILIFGPSVNFQFWVVPISYMIFCGHYHSESHGLFSRLVRSFFAESG